MTKKVKAVAEGVITVGLGAVLVTGMLVGNNSNSQNLEQRVSQQSSQTSQQVYPAKYTTDLNNDGINEHALIYFGRPNLDDKERHLVVGYVTKELTTTGRENIYNIRFTSIYNGAEAVDSGKLPEAENLYIRMSADALRHQEYPLDPRIITQDDARRISDILRGPAAPKLPAGLPPREEILTRQDGNIQLVRYQEGKILQYLPVLDAYFNITGLNYTGQKEDLNPDLRKRLEETYVKDYRVSRGMLHGMRGDPFRPEK